MHLVLSAYTQRGKEMAELIEMGKEYEDMDGYPVIVYTVSRKGSHPYPVVIEEHTGVLNVLTEDGRHHEGGESTFIRERKPWSSLRRGDRCLVWADGSALKRRYYFAGETDGKPHAFDGQKTEWAGGCRAFACNNCIPWVEGMDDD